MNIQAFETFYKDNHSLFFHQAFNLIEDWENSRDIVAECFEYVWTHHRDADIADMRAYMHVAIKNRCIDFMRRQQVKDRFIDFQTARAQAAADSAADEEKLAEVYKVIQSLPPATRHVLEECYLKKKKYQEVAQELGIGVNMVKKHIVKALSILRSALANK